MYITCNNSEVIKSKYQTKHDIKMENGSVPNGKIVKRIGSGKNEK